MAIGALAAHSRGALAPGLSPDFDGGGYLPTSIMVKESGTIWPRPRPANPRPGPGPRPGAGAGVAAVVVAGAAYSAAMRKR